VDCPNGKNGVHNFKLSLHRHRTFRGTFEKFSATRKVHWQIVFRELFRNFSGTFQELFRNFSGTFQELFRNFSGTFQELFRNFSGTFKIFSTTRKLHWQIIFQQLPMYYNFLNYSKKVHKKTTF
jgi:hypothetical protein